MICIYKEIERGIESVSDVIRNLCIYLGRVRERARNNKAIEQKDRKLFFSIKYSTEINR